MSSNNPQTAEPTILMTAEEIASAVDGIAREIIEGNESLDSVVLLGILRRGRPLADRLAMHIEKFTSVLLRVGSLATTLYRDDLRSGAGAAKIQPRATHFDFDVNGVTVILVDDVIASGRTVRAALDELMDYGRPARVQLACLIDRGLRELPIQADYLGLSISTDKDDHIAVRLDEMDYEDVVLLERGEPSHERD